ncbi:MAG: SdrD B-like domain-containing protein [Steroidobacteraceae bacterium]
MMPRRFTSGSLTWSAGIALAMWLCVGARVHAAIGVDTANISAGKGSTTALSWLHTVAAGDSRILVVGCSLAKTPETITSVTYGGTPLVLIGTSPSPIASDTIQMYLYRMVAPPVGTTSIQVNVTKAKNLVCGAITFTGVDQYVPTGSFAGATGTSTAPSVTLASAPGEVVIDTVSAAGDGGALTVGGAPQIQRWNDSTGNAGGDAHGGGSTKPGAASVTMNWSTGSSKAWAIGAVPLKPAPLISGKVFEDANYGGGAGRSFAASGGAGQQSARAELYDENGNFVTSATTDAAGNYTLISLGAGHNHTVRVVNSSVTSSRGASAGLLPVQTFRTNGLTGTVGTADPNRVGGEAPQLADAGNGGTGTTMNTTSGAFTAGITGQAESITTVALGASDVTGIDFGFNFNTIVNKNDAGQGSLRQFILNSNALGNAGLAIQGQTAGKDVSIFMISDGLLHPGLRAGLTNQLNASGVATITLTSIALPSISAADTTIDGGTQTTNVGNTNAGFSGDPDRPQNEAVGTGLDGIVGTGDEASLPSYARPEVEINGGNLGTILNLAASNTTVKNLAVFNRPSVGRAMDVSAGTGSLITQCFVGPRADGTDPGAASRVYIGVYIGTGSANVTSNFIGYTVNTGIQAQNTSVISTNDLYNNALEPASFGDGITVEGSSGQAITITQNRIDKSGAYDLDAWEAPGPFTITENSLYRSHTSTTVETGGLRIFGSGSTVARNVVTTSAGAGITVVVDSVRTTTTGNILSKNSLHSNGGLGIDLDVTNTGAGNPNGDGVTPNNGTTSASLPNTGFDYPVITLASLSGSTLTLTGYVGTASTKIAGTHTLEFFKADNDGNNNGPIILGDGLSVPHGEGRWYLGTCNTAADGTFNCAIAVPAAVPLALGDLVTGTARDAGGNTSEFGADATVAGVITLSGRVFEDVNYGGGAGRDRSVAGAAPQANARVELYNSSGTFVDFRLTDASGNYSFAPLATGNYTVRVVNSSVSSSRGAAAGLIPVQTFRTNGLTGTVGTADPNRVGGENPALVDAGNGSTTLAALTTATTTAESITPVALGASGATGIDFGFNFNTIVNTGDAGQGSLRQFILNSNALSNVGLAIQGQTAGKDVSIFMISDGATHPGLRGPPDPLALANQLTGGVAVITPATALPAITAADTTLDGTTQTVNVGNTNSVTLGVGGTVGVDALVLGQLNGPEVAIRDIASLAVGIDIQATNATVRGFAVYGFGAAVGEGAVRVTGNSGALIENNVLGSTATAFTDPGVALHNARAVYASGATSGTIRNNLIGFGDFHGIMLDAASNNWTVSGNEVRDSALNDSSGDGIDINASSGAAVTGNLFIGSASQGVRIGGAAANNAVTNNTMTNNGIGTATTMTQSGAVTLRTGVTATTLDRNIISANYGAGVQVNDGASGTIITRNSIANNGTINGRNGAGPTGQIGIDLNAPSDNSDLGTSPFVTVNDAGDTDTGGNGLLNYPILTSALISGSNLVLSGYALPGSAIELFIATADPSGFGEGQTYLSTLTEGSGADTDGTSGTYGPAPINGIAQGTDTTNKFRFSIPLPGGVAAGTKLTATATLSGNTSEFSGNATVAVSSGISGTVFEDVNYGGGAGRDHASSAGVVRPGATVELYNNGGAFVTSTTTDASGDYLFGGLAAGNYTVRAVNGTVSSSRTGYVAGLLPVQTFRTNASSGVAVAVTDYVGGQNPSVADAGAGSAGATLNTSTGVFTAGPTGTAQSISNVTLGATGITGVDFGFNFDAIVNKNDAGQGSLRQFISNANALGNGTLAQVGQTAGKEVTIFMMSDGAAHPGLRVGLTSQLTGTVAAINVSSELPAITGADTIIDGTTQTVDVGDTNAGQLGVGGSVGVDNLALPKVNAPEVQLSDGGGTLFNGLSINANNVAVRGIAIYGFGSRTFNSGDQNIRVDGGTGILIETNVIGSTATSFTDPGAATRSGNDNIDVNAGTGIIRNNLIGFASTSGIALNAGASSWTVQGNEVRANSQVNNFCEALVSFSSGHSILGNLMIANRGSGLDLYNSTATNLIENNAVTQSGIATTLGETAGVRVSGSGGVVRKDVIFNNYGAGVLVPSVSSRVTITQNSIYGNGTITTESGGSASGEIGIDLLDSGDDQLHGTNPFVTLNDAGDADAGGNGLFNYPVLSSVLIVGSNLVVSGYSRPNSDIELFIAAADPTGFGEGQTYLTTLTEGSGADTDGTSGTYGPAPINGIAQGTDTTNKFQFSIPLPGGVSAGTKLTATATLSGNTSEFSGNVTVTNTSGISGTVFEDVNYGGGAGRDRTSATGVARPGAAVELYDNSGTFVASTTTDASGNYSFGSVTVGNYTVRVVNSSVSSSRTGYVAGLLPVQTFRTNASSGVAVAVTDYVGGQNPSVADAGAGAVGATLDTSTGVFTAGPSGTAQSITNVTLGAAGIAGVDFGFNFDTIVNVNDTGQGSLRQLITNANTLTGDASLAQAGLVAAKENAVFMISNGTAAAGLRAANNYFVGGVATIAPVSVLPTISAPLVLDATKQPGFTATPVVELNGAGSGGVSGLTISAGSSAVRGLVINRFTQAGVYLITGGTNLLAGNYIGTNAAGTAALANSFGIEIDNSPNNVIGGTVAADANVVSGNVGKNISLDNAGSTGNLIEGNRIGTNATGTAAIASAVGVQLTNAPSNTIGGTTSGAGNLISGNASQGIFMIGSTTGTVVQGNLIGTNAAGTAAIPNNFGVFIAGPSGNTVGGTTAAARNVISGNTTVGLDIQGVTATNNVVAGNYIGLDVTGAAAVPNGAGVILSDTLNNTVGGTAAGAGNVVSGNSSTGVAVAGVPTTGNVIQGNRIGTNAAGSGFVANGGDGVSFGSGANHDNTLGGTAAGAPNIIAGNGQNGVRVSSGVNNAILENSIYGNTLLGINLGSDLVTPNNGTKNAALPNSDMDFPVITASSLLGTTLTVAGYVGSAPNQGTFGNARVEFFKSDNDPSGYGEGPTYLGSLTTDVNGNFAGNLTVSGLLASDRITATATDASNNTSEFAANFIASQLGIVKRAFWLDGTPIASGATIPSGVSFYYLLYISNRDAARTDVSLSDVLDPAFQYQTGTIRTQNTTAACAASACTAGEEATIFADASSGTLRSDTVDGDIASYSAGSRTLSIGNQSVANGQLDIAGNRVFAALFRVRMP